MALRHPQRLAELQRVVGDVDLQLFNVCADAIVNSALAHLTWLQLPSAAVQLDALLASALGLRMSAESALLEWDVERLYRAIDDRRPAKERRRAAGRSRARAERCAGAVGSGAAPVTGPRGRPAGAAHPGAGPADRTRPAARHAGAGRTGRRGRAGAPVERAAAACPRRRWRALDAARAAGRRAALAHAVGTGAAHAARAPAGAAAWAVVVAAGALLHRQPGAGRAAPAHALGTGHDRRAARCRSWS